MVILLTSAQAAAVSGPSAEAGNISALAPLPLTDGRFYLGVSVLDDPTHAEHHDALAALPQADYASLAALMPADPKA